MKVEPLDRSFGAKVSELSLPDLNQDEIGKTNLDILTCRIFCL